MMKKYMFVLVACLACLSIQAQDYFAVPVKGTIIPTVQQQKAKANAPENYATWGYCGNNVVYSIGVQEEAELSSAIYVPREALGVYKDAKVAGVRIGLSAESKNVSGFLKEGNDLNAKNKLTTSTSNALNVGLHDLMFRVPFQISGDFIVGYTATGTNQIGFDGEETVQNACYLCVNGQWGSVYKAAKSNGWGSVSIQLLLTGDNMPTSEMSMESMLTLDVEQNKSFDLRGVVANKTNVPVSNYEITCSFTGGESVVSTIDHTVLANANDTFSIAMDGIDKIGNLPMEVTITKVNGEPDANPKNNSLIHAINVIEEGCYFLQKVVAEEATSVFCGFCPRGIVVMESMKQRFPDNFIGIAVHMDNMGYDPMIAEPYLKLGYILKEDGLPNGIVNRKRDYSGDPLYFERYFEKEIQHLAKANVVIKSVSDVENKSINVKVATRFAQNISNAKYKLAFVLLENGVTGYEQLNAFYNGGYGSMGGFENLPQHASITFNDVARGIWNFDGIENSIPSKITKKVDYEYSYDIPVPSSVMNNKNLEVVVLLLHSETGEIVQADKLAVGKKHSSIESVDAENNWNVYAENGQVKVEGEDYVALQVYALDGTLVRNEGLSAGIYVVRVIASNKMYSQKVVVE